MRTTPLALLVLLSLAACGGASTTDAGPGDSGAADAGGDAGADAGDTDAGIDAGGDAGVPDQTDGGDPTGVTLSGDALPFAGGPDARIAGAFVTVLERPELHQTTGADGHFDFGGLAIGSEITLRMTHPRYTSVQIGTITLDATGASRVTFQAPTPTIYDALAAVVSITPDPAACQLVSTVTRIGRSVYDAGAHGEAGAVVTVDPPLSADHGPIYFNASVIPDRTLTMTSDDGGVLYTNVPPGRYVLTATKAGATFRTVTMKCEAGWLVNASPPWGLQRTM